MNQRILALVLVFSLILSPVAVSPARGASAAPVSPMLTAPGGPGLSAHLAPGLDPSDISPVAPLVVQFSQPMDPAGPQPALLTFPYAPGELAWNAAHTELSFTPQEPLSPDADYLVFLDQDLRSASGERFTQFQQWEIHTRTAPRVVEHTPAGPGLEERKPAIRLVFNRAMDDASVAAAFRIDPAVPYTLQWTGPKTLLVELAQPLATGQQNAGSRYRFTLAGSARDADGVPLLEAYTWEYWVDPLVVTLAPDNGQIADQLELSFSQPLDPQKNATPFAMTPAVPGAWGWSSTGTAQFAAAQPFSPGLWYTLTATAPLIDHYGSPITVTQPISFYARPPLELQIQDPRKYDSSCQVSRLSFDRPMDQAATQAAFQVSPALDGSFAWVQNSLVFTPTLPGDVTDGGESYTASLQPGTRDAQGRPILVQPYQWSFSCYRHYWEGGLGETSGAHIQVLDAEGRRAMHFGTLYTDGANLTLKFRLYALSLDDFIRRYYAEESFASLPESPSVSWQMPGSSDNIQEFFISAEAPPGLYILRVSTQPTQLNPQQAAPEEHFIFLVLSANTLIVKHGVGQLSAWLSDVNGRPYREPAEVRVYDDQGHQLARGGTHKDGLFQLPLSTGPHPDLVIARTETPAGDDITVAGTGRIWGENSQWARYWWMDDDADRLPALAQHKIYAYTDRPIYRPGQTVYFKAIVRQDNDARYSLVPAGTPVEVRLRDGRDNILQTLQTGTNAFGSLNGAFRLAEETGLGEYNLQFKLAGESHRQAFKVQEYRKPDFQVKLAPDARQYVFGDPIQVGIDTQYFYGQPVAKARLTVQLYSLDDYSSYWWDGDTRAENAPYVWSNQSYHTETALTNASGHYTLTLKAQMPEDEYRRWSWWGDSLEKSPLAIEVTADDGSGQTVSGYAIVQVYNAAEKISLSIPGRYEQKIGQAFPLTANVHSLKDEPVTGRALELVVTRWSREDWKYHTVTETLSTSGADGQASFSLALPEAGYYHLTLTGKDAGGRPMMYSDYVYILEQGQQSWFRRYGEPSEYDDSEYITISAEQKSYKPYQTARFMIESDFSGPALLTFERSQVYRSLLVRLTAPLTVLEVPLLESDAPNTFVTINAWQPMSTSLAHFRATYPEETYWFYNLPDSRLRTDRVEIQVEPVLKALQVDLSSDQSIYAPGQPATVTVQVSDAQGQPAAAEVSLALVDESIFSLSGELSQPIFDAFYGRRPLQVLTFDSMAPYREIIVPGRGGGGGEPADTSQELRSDFQDTAVWLPALETGADGRVTATVTLLDNLTSWRLVARAVTQDTRVGEARLNVLTQRPLVVQPVLPHSLVVSDTLTLGAIIHNYGPERTFDVTLAANRLEVSTPQRTIRLGTGEAGRVTWQTRASQPGPAQVTIRAVAQDGSGGDAVQLPLAIDPLAVPYAYNQVGSFQGRLDTNLVLPYNAAPDSTVQLHLSRSLGDSLLQGLEYLTGYPYGCVEQTMSRALPNAVVGRALAQLGGEGASLDYDLPRLVSAGLAKLYSLQHLDGGWGWWSDDDTHDYQTAWVVFGLAVTAEAGYPVDEAVIRAGAGWLSEHLAQMDERTRAYALYSLAVAGYGERAATLSAADTAYRLDAFSQASLALALHKLGETQASLAVLDRLAGQAVQANGQVYWPADRSDGEYHHKTMASSLRSTALALQALARIRPADALIPGSVQYLISQRQPQGWGTTNETAYAVLALTDYLVAIAQSGQPTGYRILLNDQELQAGELTAGASQLDLTIPARQLHVGLNGLSILQAGDAPLYYSLAGRVYLPSPAIQGAGSLSVMRTYQDPGSGQEIDRFAPGQPVRVVFKIKSTQPAAYIMLEDHLPGGLEALNTALNTTSHDAVVDENGQQYELRYWQDYGYNNKEIRGSRVLFFITWLEAGEATITYLARAVQPGRFSALPAELTAMYDAATWGRSDSTILEIADPGEDLLPGLNEKH